MNRIIMFGCILLLVGCTNHIPKHLRPVSDDLQKIMQRRDLSVYAPIMIRIFKESSEFEVWKSTSNGSYVLLKQYPICKWSGIIGAKKAEGDYQSPEGFYMVAKSQLNPKSKYYLSFNLGFPNQLDTRLGRYGSHVMVHGKCSSVGCYAMTNEMMSDIYALARDALDGGQQAFQVHIFPFRMTQENLNRYREHPDYRFWLNLKEGSDAFENSHTLPRISVCKNRYVFNVNFSGVGEEFSPCPGR